MLKPVLVFCCFVCTIVSWQDPCVLSAITQTGPKHGDEISQLELMSSGHLWLSTPPTNKHIYTHTHTPLHKHMHCVCFVCKASAAKTNLILQTGIFLKDLNAVNNSKPSLTRFTPGALCNLSGLPCASSNACIMLKCKSVSCQRGGRESPKKESLKGPANILIEK